jgi:hypothetical protein
VKRLGDTAKLHELSLHVTELEAECRSCDFKVVGLQVDGYFCAVISELIESWVRDSNGYETKRRRIATKDERERLRDNTLHAAS